MINVNINGELPEKIERIAPQLSVNKDGSINWTPAYTDHNASAFFRGKTLSPEEYNAALVKQIVQANYLSDSLSEFFNKQLSTVIYNNFINKFNLERSYIKIFLQEDWGEQQEDGYWYINIPASEHGFKIASQSQDIYERMNIDTNMYILGHNGRFKEVTQADIDTENTVRLFTDDNTLTGFVVIRTNDKAYALAEGYTQAHQITGLAAVATSGKYADLVDINAADGPNTKIKANAIRIQQLIDGSDANNDLLQVYRAQFAGTADYAKRVEPDARINDVLVSEIFKSPASSIVKLADTASNVDTTNLDTGDNDKVRFQLGTGNVFEKTINNVTHALTATTANIKNLDVGANAKVKLQIGEGTIFEKEITNVQRAYNLIDGGTIASTVTGVTQGIEDDSTKIATTAFVQNIRKYLEENMGTWEMLYDNPSNSSTSVTLPESTVNKYTMFKIWFKRGNNGISANPGEYTLKGLQSGTALPIYFSAQYTLKYSGGTFTSPNPDTGGKVVITAIAGLKA